MTNNEHALNLEQIIKSIGRGINTEFAASLRAGAAALRGEPKVAQLWKAEGLEEVAKIVGNAYAARVIRAEAARLRAKGGA